MYNTCTVQLYIHIVCISHVYVFIPPTIGFSRLLLHDYTLYACGIYIIGIDIPGWKFKYWMFILYGYKSYGVFFNESNIDSWEFLSYITWLHLCGVKVEIFIYFKCYNDSADVCMFKSILKNTSIYTVFVLIKLKVEIFWFIPINHLFPPSYVPSRSHPVSQCLYPGEF